MSDTVLTVAGLAVLLAVNISLWLATRRWRARSAWARREDAERQARERPGYTAIRRRDRMAKTPGQWSASPRVTEPWWRRIGRQR